MPRNVAPLLMLQLDQGVVVVFWHPSSITPGCPKRCPLLTASRSPSSGAALGEVDEKEAEGLFLPFHFTTDLFTS